MPDQHLYDTGALCNVKGCHAFVIRRRHVCSTGYQKFCKFGLILTCNTVKGSEPVFIRRCHKLRLCPQHIVDDCAVAH